MANNFTKFDQGVTLKGSTAVLTDQGDIKYDSSVSAFIGNAAGVTGKFLFNPTTDALTAGSISTTGNLNVGGSVSITGSTVLTALSANSLSVTGNSILGAITASSETVTGNTILAGVSANTLSVTGNSVLAALTANSETVTGNLLVNGTATLGTLAVTGNSSLTGTLGVTGAATLQGALVVNNTATITDQLAVSGQALLGNRATFTEITTPASPAASSLSVYAKSDNKLYKLTSAGVETEIGAGALGGFNFLTMVTGSFAQTQTDNSNFEGSSGSWALYNDGANAAPTSMSGGTPTGTTLVVTGTNPLDGASSLQFTKDAANRQGNGFSCTATVPPAYRGQNATIILPFKVTGGSIVQGDLKVFAYAIDGAASGTITPFNNDIVGGQGVLYSTLPLPTDATRYRVGVHIASTASVAATALFDDIQFTPQQATIGVPSSDWADYTLVIGGSTSAPTEGGGVVKKARWRRVGDSVQISFSYNQTSGGADGSGTYLFPLPSGLSIDTTKQAVAALTNLNIVGIGQAFSNNPCHAIAYNSNNIALVAIPSSGIGAATFVGSTFSNMSNSLQYFTFTATVPVNGWSSNVTISSSSTYKISSYLATGSRVTGAAPTLLGQYRSYLRNSSANTFTETNGDPTTVPNNSDGILIYRNTAWATVNSNNQPTKYDIFVGKNKNAKFVFFKSAGRTGTIDISPSQFTSTILTGYVTDYDPTTGIATIVAPANSSSTTAANTGFDETGAAVTSNVYFDIIVSENALAVASDIKPQLLVRPSTGVAFAAAFGTTFPTYDTPIFDTHSAFVKTTGIFTAPETGYYSVDTQFCSAGTSDLLGLRLVKNKATTPVTQAETFNLGSAGTVNPFSRISITVRLSAGETLTMETNDSGNSTNATSERLWLSISKVSN